MDDEDSSFIGRKLRQTGDLLLGGAQKQVGDYRSKFEGLKGTYDDFLSKLLVSYSGAKFDPSFVDKFFGKRKLSFAGIDGTILKYDVFDLVVFIGSRLMSSEPFSMSDWWELPYGIKDIQTQQGKATFYY